MPSFQRFAGQEIEAGFPSFDGTRLFYRAWLPAEIEPQGTENPPRVFIFLHRGHEHSARIRSLLPHMVGKRDLAFAWDARGHGHSPGERGDAPDFYTLVKDFDAFVSYLMQQYGFCSEQVVVIANSVGAVIAATWVHDFAPRIRGVVMAAPAFEINLYVPLAKPALRLACCFKPDLTVTSYIRSGMLTHSAEEAAAYDADPLITKNIAARVLLDLADTAERVVADASAIDVPVLMLVADQDYVVKEGPQRLFFDRLATDLKQWVKIEQCHHAIFYEAETRVAFDATRAFIEACFQRKLPTPESYATYDQNSPGAVRYRALKAGDAPTAMARALFGFQRLMLSSLGRASEGMRIGLAHGFDSGASLDYVYNNRAQGRWLIGKTLDQGYLDAVGWRGIRLRKIHLQQTLSELIERFPADQPVRILDIAAGGGRYLLETAKRYQDRPLSLTLRDYAQHNLDQAKALAAALSLTADLDFQRRDAFDLQSYQGESACYDIVIVSGLYELFPENACVQRSLTGIMHSLRAGGYLIYTGQPWHPQLDLIACTLNSHQGDAWVMRPRPQAEIDALVHVAGCRKVSSRIGLNGIFTVSTAQKVEVLAATT